MAERVRVVNIFGGADLDLREATLAAPDVRLTVVSIFGGSDIVVPEGINVELSSFALFGGDKLKLRRRRGGAGRADRARALRVDLRRHRRHHQARTRAPRAARAASAAASAALERPLAPAGFGCALREGDLNGPGPYRPRAPSRPRRTPQGASAGLTWPTPTAGARGIRWDRVSRVALLVVLLGMLFLYVGPARSYWSTVQEAKHRRAEVARLKHENTKLRARRDALRNPAALEREARRLGMVRPGERSYVVKHLPKGP